jgi:RNase P subunit RPR2
MSAFDNPYLEQICDTCGSGLYTNCQFGLKAVSYLAANVSQTVCICPSCQTLDTYYDKSQVEEARKRIAHFVTIWDSYCKSCDSYLKYSTITLQ